MANKISLYTLNHGFTAAVAIAKGDQLILTADNTVGLALGGTPFVIGEAMHDAAAGERVTVHTRFRRIVEDGIASGGILLAEQLNASGPAAGVNVVESKADPGDPTYAIALSAALDTETLSYGVL